MKANFNFTRNAVLVILFSLSFTNLFSQKDPSVKPVTTNLKAIVENNNIILNWTVSEMGLLNYCKVQASTDGITFYTVGMVMGSNPQDANNNTFSFKQSIAKMRPGQAYYRILNVEAGEIAAYASNVAKVL
jgi:hypothetical protein